jgi:aspartyl-tRNA(Asn)/glutamyl-tRNA(Gln) amidotransferase subunit C
MSLNASEIQRIANLARLELTPDQSERMLTQINSFFEIVEQMRAVDTSGIEPLAHPVAVMQDIALRLREDIASEPNQREANQQSAPAIERGLFLVPKVIE